MNSLLDPPDETEIPECCGDFMTVDGNVFRCEVCLRCEEIEMEPEYDPSVFDGPCIAAPDEHLPDNQT